jgi:hypothetical protein
MTFIHHNFKAGFVSQTGLPAALDSNFAKYSKRLFVDGLNEPPILELEKIKAFFNKTMDKLGFTVDAPGSSVVAVSRALNIDDDEKEGDEEKVKNEEVKKGRRRSRRSRNVCIGIPNG